MKRKDLTMHRLLGEHSFKPIMNEATWEYDQVCDICGTTENLKPASTHEEDHMLDAFRYGMIDAADVLGTFGIDESITDVEIESNLPPDLERELLDKTIK